MSLRDALRIPLRDVTDEVFAEQGRTLYTSAHSTSAAPVAGHGGEKATPPHP